MTRKKISVVIPRYKIPWEFHKEPSGLVNKSGQEARNYDIAWKGLIDEMPLLAAEGWEVFILGRAETRIHFLRPGVRGFHLGPRAWEPYWVIHRKGHPGARSREEWDLRFAQPQLLHSVKKEQDKLDAAKEGLRKEASDWDERFTNHTNGSFYHRTADNSLYDSRLSVGRSETLLTSSKWSTELAEKLKFKNLDEKGTIVLFAFLSELASHQVSSSARPETETVTTSSTDEAPAT